MRRASAMDGAANFAAWSALGIILTSRAAFATAAPDTRVANITFGPQAAPTTQQAAVAPPKASEKSHYESIELAKRAPQQKNNPTSLITSDSGVARVVGALGVVVGCIFIVRWAGKRFLGLQTTGSGCGVVQVLSRTPVSPRQQLMLIQVGRRIVLVANCGVQMNALCEINDADEVAAIAGQLQERRRTSATSAFLSIFGKAGAKFEAQQPPIAPPDIASDEAESPSDEPLEPELATTRQEMRGLMDRVHQLAQHYRRSST